MVLQCRSVRQILSTLCRVDRSMACPVTAIVSFGTDPSISHLIGKRDPHRDFLPLFCILDDFTAIAIARFSRWGLALSRSIELFFGDRRSGIADVNDFIEQVVPEARPHGNGDAANRPADEAF